MSVMTIPFIAASAASYGCQVLDWYNTKRDLAKGNGKEKNPIIGKLFSVSPWLALAYKIAPSTACVVAALHFGDIGYWNVKYVNAPGVDKWAIGWILTQLGVAGIGLYGYLSSKKA